MIISVKNLCKGFRVFERKEGIWGSLSSFFSRKYKVRRALDEVSFDVGEGELIGYIGPNGSGKSTTVKILSGILVPDGGEVQVMGKIPWKNRIDNVRDIGVVFGQRTQLWWDLPAIESFKLLRDIYKISDYKDKLDSLIDSLDLEELLNVPVRLLSLGQRMRCDIAASLLHSPKILFLDEPTIGLDAVSKLAVIDFIRRLNREEGVTIILTTHDMDDIESLCKRILILNEGQLFFDGSIEDIRKISPERFLIVDLLNEDDSIDYHKTEFLKQEGHRVWLKFDPNEIATPDLISSIISKHAIRDLYVENPPIEQVVAKLYKGL